jgi:hypothetical protein
LRVLEGFADPFEDALAGDGERAEAEEFTEGSMTPQGQPATSAPQALAGDGTLTGSWTLDPARSEVRLHSRHTWGLLPVRGVFGQVAGNGTVTAAGQVTGTLVYMLPISKLF